MGRANPRSSDKSEIESISNDVARTMGEWKPRKPISLLVGIAFDNEEDILKEMVEIARKGLLDADLQDQSAILATGSHDGQKALEMLHRVFGSSPDSLPPVRGFLLPPGQTGRGPCTRTLLEAAKSAASPLVLLGRDVSLHSDGPHKPCVEFHPGWLRALWSSTTQYSQDLALGHLVSNPLYNPVESLLAYPVITAVLGLKIQQPMWKISALSRRMIARCLAEPEDWSKNTGALGLDLWITMRAISEKLKICSVPIGSTRFQGIAGRLKIEFRQVAKVLFDGLDIKEICSNPDVGLIATPPTLGQSFSRPAPVWQGDLATLKQRFRAEFDHFDATLYSRILPLDLQERFQRLRAYNSDAIALALSQDDWVEVLKTFLVAFFFDTRFHPDDIIDSLYPFFLARFVTLAEKNEEFHAHLETRTELRPEERALVSNQKASGEIEDQVQCAFDIRKHLKDAWEEKALERGSYLPRICTWEFIPNVSVTVPQELPGPRGEIVNATKVYQELIDKNRLEFLRFLQTELNIDTSCETNTMLKCVEGFMASVETCLGTIFTIDLSNKEEVTALGRRLITIFSREPCLQLTEDAARQLIWRVPPKNLPTHLGAADLETLLKTVSPKDALAMAALTDRHSYMGKILDLISTDGTGEWFEPGPLKPVCMEPDTIGNADEIHGKGPLFRLAGRVLVSKAQTGWRGAFPTLWFVLRTIRRIIAAEQYTHVWQNLIAEHAEAGAPIVASITGFGGRRIMSAHNGFENHLQRLLAKRLVEFAEELARQDASFVARAETLKAAAEAYHLSITLPDVTFVPLSLWTWASYSHRGGQGVPTPLSSLVERDWATVDFLTSFLRKTGRGDEITVQKSIFKLVGEGRADRDLGEHLLGTPTAWEDVEVLQTLSGSLPDSAPLLRMADKPILEPLPKNPWESRYVLNAAAVRLDGKIFIFYRAFGDDKISRIGLAWTEDGIHIEGRLENPIFGPKESYESAGTEDPRVTIIGDRLYMLYTAWDLRVPQIAMASIARDSFLKHRWDDWKCHGLGFPGMPNKDAVLYPETFNGRYVIYHRIDPGMWVSYLDTLECPWPRTGQMAVVGPRPGMMWDGVKIGAGASPIKTTHGWLNIYHGVDYNRHYRLGALLMDLHDPAKVIYRSPNPILEPTLEFETGGAGKADYWVPHVVFTCGAVPARDTGILGLDDEIFVYYGGADTAIGVAKGRLRDIVPVLEK